MTAWRLLWASWLRWCIRADEKYLKACERDGLVHSLDLAAFRRRIGGLRVRLALTRSGRKAS